MTLPEPNINNLNHLDTAVLLNKYILLNGMLHHGTTKEKIRAKEELKEMNQSIHGNINLAAIAKAMVELGVSQKELQTFTQFSL